MPGERFFHSQTNVEGDDLKKKTESQIIGLDKDYCHSVSLYIIFCPFKVNNYSVHIGQKVCGTNLVSLSKQRRDVPEIS